MFLMEIRTHLPFSYLQRESTRRSAMTAKRKTRCIVSVKAGMARRAAALGETLIWKGPLCFTLSMVTMTGAITMQNIERRMAYREGRNIDKVYKYGEFQKYLSLTQ